MHRKLARPGPEQIAFHTDQVANVEQLKERKVAVAHRVQPYIDLQTNSAPCQMCKARLAVGTNRNHAPGDTHTNFLRFQLFRRVG